MIVSYGTTCGTQFSYCDDLKARVFHRHKKQEIEYIRQKMKWFLNCDPECTFLFFDQQECAYYRPFFDAISCCNDLKIVKFLNSKIFTRYWLQPYVEQPPFIVTPIGSLKYEGLARLFPESNAFVLQENTGTGGLNTIVVDSDAALSNQTARYSAHKLLSVSPLLCDQTSISQNILIGADDCVLLQPSVQEVNTESDRPLYAGSDFVAYLSLPADARKKIYETSRVIARLLNDLGYRGFAGIDYMLASGKVYFSEINPRFQSSTDMVGTALARQGLPNIFELQNIAFGNSKGALGPLKQKLESLTVEATRHEVIWTRPGDEDRFVGDRRYQLNGSAKRYSSYERDVFLAFLD